MSASSLGISSARPANKTYAAGAPKRRSNPTEPSTRSGRVASSKKKFIKAAGGWPHSWNKHCNDSLTTNKKHRLLLALFVLLCGTIELPIFMKAIITLCLVVLFAFPGSGLMGKSRLFAAPQARDTWRSVRTNNLLLIGNADPEKLRQVAAWLEFFHSAFARLVSRNVLESSV